MVDLDESNLTTRMKRLEERVLPGGESGPSQLTLDDDLSVSSSVTVEDDGVTIADSTAINFGAALDGFDDGDGTVTVDADLSSVAGDRLSLPGSHTNYEAGLTDEEIARFSVLDGETLTLERLEVSLKGGGTDAGFTADVFDETNGVSVASTSDTTTADQTVSGPAEVLVRVSNSTGAAQDATIAASMRVN